MPLSSFSFPLPWRFRGLAKKYLQVAIVSPQRTMVRVVRYEGDSHSDFSPLHLGSCGDTKSQSHHSGVKAAMKA